MLLFISSVSPLAKFDVPCKRGDQQYDGKAGEQPCVLDQEEDDLSGSFLLILCNALHLWKLRRKMTIRYLSHAKFFNIQNTLILLFNSPFNAVIYSLFGNPGNHYLSLGVCKSSNTASIRLRYPIKAKSKNEEISKTD